MTTHTAGGRNFGREISVLQNEGGTHDAQTEGTLLVLVGTLSI